MICIHELTKDYGCYKGIFDISFSLQQGEIVAFLGPNGSGKTTTIRHLMGFIKADHGKVKILDMDCFTQAKEISQYLGYLPGEIAFIEDMKGIDFIRFIAEMRGIKDFLRIDELIEYFELDAKQYIKKMSKGMKQKVGLVIAFMKDVPIYILDEPTSGLDPLMQNKFVEYIQKLKKEGKTILMSSHIFEEVENTCDRIIVIKEGRIIADELIMNIKNKRKKHYEIIFVNEIDALQFSKKYECILNKNKVSLFYNDVNELIQELHQYKIDELLIRSQSIEEIFLQYYGG